MQHMLLLSALLHLLHLRPGVLPTPPQHLQQMPPPLLQLQLLMLPLPLLLPTALLLVLPQLLLAPRRIH